MAEDVADPAEREVLDGARSERGTLSVSGLNARLGVEARVQGRSARQARVILRGTPARAWGVVSGTRPHQILPRKGKVVVTPEGPRPAVNHPGTRRRDVWGKATTRATTRIARRVDEAGADAVGDLFGM